MRCAVVGHVEWTEFARVPAMPRAGEIVHATEVWEEPAGGGAVVAAQLAKLAGRCQLFTALGDDELGRRASRRLAELGVDVHTQRFGTTRRALTHVDAAGERTITVLGDKLLPRGPLPLHHGYDLVFFVSGDAGALVAAREASFLAATPRELPTLRAGGVRIDLLVGSATDPGERYDGGLDVGTVVTTRGAEGGEVDGVPFAAAIPSNPVGNAYGAGDSFAAALAFGLARGDALDAALVLATRAGAAVLAGPTPYAAQITR